MPFEEAKQQFEKKAQKAPEKVEGNWDQFKTETKDYFAKKQNEVTGYIDKAKYQGSDIDKNNYLAEMRKALDDVIDGNEATKQEMADYKNVLSSKSEKLKQKLEEESTRLEFEDAARMLGYAGIKFNIADNVRTYLSVPKAQRLPTNYIKDSMDKIYKSVSEFQSTEVLKTIKANENVLCTMFNFLCYGNKDRAESLAKPVIETLKFVDLSLDTHRKLNVWQLDRSDTVVLMLNLVRTGVKKEKVVDYLLNGVNKLRSLDGDNFNNAIAGFNSRELAGFLLTNVVAVNEGKMAEVKDIIKYTLQIESSVSKIKTEMVKKFETFKQDFKNENDELKKYREKNPNVMIDAETARLEKEIAHSQYSLIDCKQEMVLADAKKELAYTYLNEKSVNPSSPKTAQIINEIFNAKLSSDLEKTLIKCQLKNVPRQFELLKATEVELDLARETYNQKKDIEANRKINQSEDVHGLLNKFYKTGELSSEGKSVLFNEYGQQGLRLKKLIDGHLESADISQAFFEGINKKYKYITEMPQTEIISAAERLTGQMAYLKNIHSMNVKFLGVLESQLAVAVLDSDKKDIQDAIKTYKTKAKETADQLNKIAVFMGHKEDKSLTDIDSLVMSPIALPMIQKEFIPFLNGIEQQRNNIVEAAGPLDFIGKNIQKQAKENARLVPYQFDKGIGLIDNLASTMEAGRKNLQNTEAELVKLLKNPETAKNLPDSLKAARIKVLEGLIDKINAHLNDPKSPFSEESISKVEKQSEKLTADRDKMLRHGLYKGIATAFILCAAVGTAVAGGWALGALGAKIFTGGTLLSSVGIGTMSMTGVAAGSVLGSRAAMSGLQAIDMADFGGQGNIWKPKQMAKDFAYSFALSVLAVGTAKSLVKSLTWAAKQEGYVGFRMPGMAKFSRVALNKLDGVSRFASPSEWFQGASKEAARKQIFRRFGQQTKEEVGQETLEDAVGKVSKTGEFLVSVASALKGGKGKLGVHGLEAKKVGITVEGEGLVYTAKTPQEFIAKFQEGNLGKTGVDYNMKINSDNSVTIELMSGKIDPKTGLPQIYSLVDVKPAMEMGNITTDVEFARVRGLIAVEGKPNTFTVQNNEQAMDALGDFYSRGFNLVKTESGNIRVSKGDKSIELVLSPELTKELNIKTEADLIEAAKNRSAIQFLKANAVKIKEYFSNINIKKSFQELVVKWQGDYSKFLENNPRLAKLLPADLMAIRFIPVPVIALNCGVNFEMKSPAEVAGLPSQLKPSVSSEIPTIKPGQELSTVENIKAKLDVLGAQLEAIGLSDLAKVIIDPSIKLMPVNNKQIVTLEQRQMEVKRLLKLDEDIKFETDFLRDAGLVVEAQEIENYKDSSQFQTLESRLERAKILSQGIEELTKNRIPFTPEDAAEIIYLMNGISTQGKKFQVFLKESLKADFNKEADYKARIDKEIKKGLVDFLGDIKPELISRFIELSKEKMIAPQDREILEANRDIMTPEMYRAIVVGSETFTAEGRTVMVYKGIKLGAGGLGAVHDVWYVEKPSNKVKQGVVKIPHEDSTIVFDYEASSAGNLTRVLSSDKSESADHIIKPVFASSKVIIYEKVTDSKGETTDLDKGMKTMSTKEWLMQFAGGVEGLVYLHKNGITHNDFKPGNIVAGKNGGVVIDIGSFVDARDVGRRINIGVHPKDGLKYATFLTSENNYAMIPYTPTFHNPQLLAYSIEKKLPLNLGDKYAVGTSLLNMLEKKGFIEKHPDMGPNVYSLKNGAPEGVVKLYNMAGKLMDCKNHPFPYIENNKKKGKDPNYISLEKAVYKIRKIAASLNET